MSLGGNGLSGEIPAWMGSLSRLAMLDLYGNRFSGELPSELSSLSELSWLRLGGNELTGEIPAWMGSLSSLRTLDLHGNRFSGEIPPELGELTELRVLYLERNRLTGAIPPELGSLSNLTNLDLASNQLTGEIPSELGGLSQLEFIRLGGGNRLTGCVPEGMRGAANNDLNALNLAFCEASISRYDADNNGAIDSGHEERGRCGHHRLLRGNNRPGRGSSRHRPLFFIVVPVDVFSWLFATSTLVVERESTSVAPSPQVRQLGVSMQPLRSFPRRSASSNDN